MKTFILKINKTKIIESSSYKEFYPYLEIKLLVPEFSIGRSHKLSTASIDFPTKFEYNFAKDWKQMAIAFGIGVAFSYQR